MNMNSTYSLVVIVVVLKYVRKKKKFWGRMTYFVLKDPRLARPALALEVSRGPHQRSAHLYGWTQFSIEAIERIPRQPSTISRIAVPFLQYDFENIAWPWRSMRFPAATSSKSEESTRSGCCSFRIFYLSNGGSRWSQVC